MNAGSATSRLLACGDAAVLVEVADLDAVLALATRVRAAVETSTDGFGAVLDVVPGARTVLVVVEEPAALDGLRRGLRRLLTEDQAVPNDDADPADGAQEVVEIVVTYDGPDLEDVASLTGMTPEEVVSAHAGRPWQVAFGGFAPGFAYLTGGDERLAVPRRDEPRTKVPVGSVGLAGTFSGVYPPVIAWGWQLIGRTDAELWDADRDPPALLGPGVRVRFVDAGDGGDGGDGG